MPEELVAFVPGRPPKVSAFEVFDDGSGPALYVGGDFLRAGQIEARNIARWDGQDWSALDLGTYGIVHSLHVFDHPGGGGPALFVGGSFPYVGQSRMEVNGLAVWDGRAWSAVPGWVGGVVRDMAVYDDDGPGPNPPALFVAGNYYLAGAAQTTRLAKWDGRTWTALPDVTGMGAGTDVRALAVFDEDGDGPNPGGLYAAGYFTHAGGIPAPGLARWGCPHPTLGCYGDCDLNGTLDFFDFLCFQNAFLAADPYADCDDDGTLTFFDFLCFQNEFLAGCP